MPNYVPTWDGDTMAFPCQQCGRRLRKVSIGYICDRCRLVLGETTRTQGDALEVRPKDRDTADHATNASSTPIAPRVGEDGQGNEAQMVGLAEKSPALPCALTITQGETDGKEADQEDANGQDAEGQEGRVLDG